MNKSKSIRLASQVLFFVLVALVAVNHYLTETGQTLPLISSASLHAICPYGGVETIVAFLRYGVMVPKIHTSAVVVTGLILLLAVIAGPVVCSYMCPLGSIQEWLGQLGKKMFGKRYNRMIPIGVDRWLRYLRYLVLIFTVYLTTNSLRLVFLEVDPYYALFNFWSDEVTVGGLIVLGVTLLSSLFIERPWCKYACPFGAVVGLTNSLSLFKIRRREATCIDCGKCSAACPMNIDVASKTTVLNHQCIRCNACTSDEVCPVEATVLLSVGKGEK